MRMFEGVDGTWIPALLPKELAWDAHMAPCTRIYECHYSPACAAVNSLDRLTLHLIMAVLLDMEHIRDSSIGNVGWVGSPSPLRGDCSPGAADASMRTNTGRRCSLHACFEPIPGFHYSHNPLCSVNPLNGVWTDPRGDFNCLLQVQLANFSGASTFFTPLSFPFRPFCPGSLRPVPVTMPHLCERMRSRRGISHGLTY